MRRKPRMAVIGAGVSGLVTAWLCQDDYEVELYEKAQCPGGHAQTVDVELGGLMSHVDAGIHAFHPRQFPRFSKLLAHLGVPTRAFGARIAVQPAGANLSSALTVAGREEFPPRVRHVVSGNTRHMLAMWRALSAGRRLLADTDSDETLRQFTARTGLSNEFYAQVLRPLCAAMWGVPTTADIDHFSAHVPMWYLSRFGFRPHEVVGGTARYIERLLADCAQVRRYYGAEVQSLRQTQGGFRIVDGHHVARDYARVVVATNAWDANRLCGEVGSNALHQALGGFRYYRTTIAVHSDARYMPARPADWSYCEVAYDEQRARATLWKGIVERSPIFASWIDDDLPRRTHSQISFYHPYMTPSHFAAQRALQREQGRGGLYFAGVYTQGVDSHESGIDSAVSIAQRVAPLSSRLRVLNFGKSAPLPMHGEPSFDAQASVVA